MFRLMIVDDESSVVDGLADTIAWERIGISTVFKAYSGIEALELLQTHSIDIVISDICMPQMGGLELLQMIRTHWRRIKTIVLSGHAEFDYAKEAMALGTSDYLLKPVSDNELLERVGQSVSQLLLEQESSATLERARLALQANLPMLRSELLNQLLQGMKYAPDKLAEQLSLLHLEQVLGRPAALMIARLEDRLAEQNYYHTSIMEYAIGNMAEEIFSDRFSLWPCKDVHGYLVFLVIPQETKQPHDAAEAGTEQQLKHLAAQLQLNVNRYLKGTISVLIGGWGIFPEDVGKLYQDALLSMRRHIGSQSDLFVYVSEEEELLPVRALQKLYEPPLLVHLMESGSWVQAEQKLLAIMEELTRERTSSQEHVQEALFFIYASFSTYAHKNGRELSAMVGSGLANISSMLPGCTMTSLKNWSLQALSMVRQSTENTARSDRSHVVGRIQRFIREHLAEDISLQAIADYMYMHPVHISRVFKLETGINVSDYVLRLKMEKAVELLADHKLKNFEVALKLGYQNPNYFFKVFKKYYSVTPQEYRINLEAKG